MQKMIFIISLIFFTFTASLRGQNPLPTQTSSLFTGAGNCALCHTGNGTVLSENGVDISPTTHWRSSMMGNSSKDPLWRAIVEEEVHEHPHLKTVIENTCTKCHAPAGNRQSVQNGEPYYTMNQLKVDPLANDGVTCTVCHQINESNYGQVSSYVGGYTITSERKIYGPYLNPFAQPMITNSNYTPVFNASIHKSELCATCHTLITPTIDYSGQIVGTFPEQTPYLEWKNSIYSTNGTECQTCHMPKTDTPIDIATLPPAHTTLRTPYWKHLFTGGNRLVNRILSNNINTLQLTASSTHFDTTLFYTEQLLSKQTVNLTIEQIPTPGFMHVGVKIENLTGHKLPSGIPYRRIWVHFKATDDRSNVVFESGNWDSEGEIIGLDSLFEPHYSEITEQDQVMIYEGVTKDVNGDLTLNLLRSAGYIKDNRIPPKGFTTSHVSYDTVAIYGDALNDSNFNFSDEEEGSGADIIYYKFPSQSGKAYNIEVQLCYQSIPARLTTYLSSIDAPDINQFLSLYNQADKSPSIIKQVSLELITGDKGTSQLIPQSHKLFQNYPNPFNPSTMIAYDLPYDSQVTLDVYNLVGEKVATIIQDETIPAGNHRVNFDASNLTSGVYFYRLKTDNFSASKKFVLMK